MLVSCPHNTVDEQSFVISLKIINYYYYTINYNKLMILVRKSDNIVTVDYYAYVCAHHTNRC